jgi:UDP-N-acetylmuramate--alanine ligase
MIKKVHFMGIGGSGVSGVASLAEKFGYGVTGCDLEKSTAYVGNIYKGHSVDHLENIDLLVVSPAVLYQNKDNPELIEGEKRGIVMTWQEFLGKILLKDKKLICIAGTHGKSTVTAMAGKLLIDNGFDPVVVIGAKVPEWGGNSRFGRGEYAIVEADEFNNNFLNYHPEIAIINNIEFDHPDFFNNENEVKESFKKFIGNLKKGGILITSEDSPHKHSSHKHFNLKVFGEHNQKNANMVFLLGKALGIEENKIIKSVESFEGIGRRLELIADRGGIKIYDDYAHHPTAIAATLQALREEYPHARILAIDEPHGYKRTKALLKNYKGVFDKADGVIIGPVFKARDEIDSSITPELVAKTSGHKNALGVNSLEDLIKNSKLEIKNSNYEVIVIMGAGKSYLWAREIAELIPVFFSNLTTFRVGGEIGEYLEIESKNDVPLAVSLAKKTKHEIFILGDGSDILVSDKEFSGVVIKYIARNFKFQISNFKFTNVTADAGLEWDKLVQETVNVNLQGLECLSGIPGTVGAAPIQNIGAYGHELSEVFVSLEAYDIEKEKFVKFGKKDCEFGYRESIFKREDHWQKYIVCSVTLELSKSKLGKVDYESLKKYLSSQNPTLPEIRSAVLAARKERLENPEEVGNAGSFFMNPIINLSEKTKLESKFPGIKIYPFGDKFKVAAGWLIELAGWKGKAYKGAGVSSKHALILINKSGKAKAKDIYDLSEKIIADVYKKFGIKLEREVQLINF